MVRHQHPLRHGGAERLGFVGAVCVVAATVVFAVPVRKSTLRIGGVESAHPIRPLLGVNAGPQAGWGRGGGSNLASVFREAGVNAIRTHDFYGPLDMSVIYPDDSRDPSKPESYDFALSDRVFATIVDAGFEPYLRIGNSFSEREVAGQARTRANAPGRPGGDAAGGRAGRQGGGRPGGRGEDAATEKVLAPKRVDNWVRAAVEVVRHYTDRTRWRGPAVKSVEIWNEPDNLQFWDGSSREFAGLFVKTAAALKRSFPDLRIGGPGYAPAGALLPRGRASVTELLDALKDHQQSIDFLSWHAYTNDADQVEAMARFYRDQLDKHGFRNTAMHVTEWNTEYSDRPNGEHDPEVRSGAKGAAIATAEWIVLQHAGVAESYFYRGADVGMDQPTFYGLFRPNGEAKPTGRAFGLWHALTMFGAQRNLSGEPKHWHAIAGQNAAGDVAVLVANPTGESGDYAIDLGGVSSCTASTLDQTDNGRQIHTAPCDRGNLHLGSWGVQLVTLK